MRWLRNKLLKTISNCLPFKTNLSSVKARDILQTFSPKPTGTCRTDNTIKIDYDLQIIVPCYNVEKWVKECLNSVLSQKTHYRVLVSIVNDGSTDGTADILQDIILKFNSSLENKPELSVGGISLEYISQSNLGLSGARNTALRRIRGTYVMFLDSDDVLPDDAVQKLLAGAFQYDADILQGSWYTFIPGNTNSIKKHILCEDGIIHENIKVFSGYAWGKLYKYNVLEHFKFPEGFLFEDTPLSFIVAAMPYKFAAIKDVVYGYRQNPEGITVTARRKKRAVDSYWITEECLKEFTAFEVAYDQRAYEYLLGQCIMNEKRARYLPYQIREAEFVLTTELMNQYFRGFSTNVKELQIIETMLKKRQYIKFDVMAHMSYL